MYVLIGHIAIYAEDMLHCIVYVVLCFSLQILSLLAEMLEQGSAPYHQSVLKLLYEYLRLQDLNSTAIKKIVDSIMNMATLHIKVHTVGAHVILFTCICIG